MILTLVRHGETTSNLTTLLDTAVPGADLTERGRAQARDLADRFAEREIDGLYISRLTRTHQTAQPLAAARGLEPVQMPGIHEITAGDYEMLGDDESMRAYVGTLRAWSVEGPHVAMPGGETGEEFFARYDADIRSIAEGSDTPVVISHGAAMRVWVAERAENIEHEYTITRKIRNTGVIELVGDPDTGWHLRSWQGEAFDPSDVH